MKRISWDTTNNLVIITNDQGKPLTDKLMGVHIEDVLKIVNTLLDLDLSPITPSYVNGDYQTWEVPDGK